MRSDQIACLLLFLTYPIFSCLMRSDTYHFSSLHEKSNQSNLWIYLEIFSQKMTALDGFIRFHARRTFINQRETCTYKNTSCVRFMPFLLCVCFFFFYLEAPGTVLMTRAGTPPTTVYAGTSFVTTAPAASTA